MLTFERMTRHRDAYICRIKGGCGAEEWMDILYGEYPEENVCVCDECPFINIINHLAELEDYLEKMEDDRK